VATQAVSQPLPIFPRFKSQILPILAAWWAVLIIAYLVSGRDYIWAILPWSTVTILMLWPVGYSLKVAYTNYRRPLFILGVLSMAYIPLAGFLLQSPLPYWPRLFIFLLLPLDLSIIGIIVSLKAAIGRPLPMFFRPDLLFGDGRVLVGGILSLVLGLRYIIGSPPMGVPFPVAKWDWYAIMFAMVAGFIPIIAVRGILKLLMRFRQIRDSKWSGWASIFIREGLLVVAVLAIGYGFHNAFLGAQPFTIPIFTTDPDFWPAIAIILASAFFLIFARGAYKRHIGQPFIKETLTQTFVKELLLVVGLIPLFYGFMSLLHMDPMHTKAGVNGLRTLGNSALLWPVGLPLILWGLIVLIPFRVLAQHYQRHAIVAQMAAVILPSQKPEHRQKLVKGMMVDGLLAMSFGQRRSYLVTMNRALAEAEPQARGVMTQTMVGVLADLPGPQRDIVMESQAAALGRLAPGERVTRMADMMGAVSQLPQDKRREFMAKMASMLG